MHGHVNLKDKLDYETNTYYQFTIFATVRLITYLLCAII